MAHKAAGERRADRAVLELSLATIDEIRKCLLVIETMGSETTVDCDAAIDQLQAACEVRHAAADGAMAEAAAPEGERASAAAASIRIDVRLLHKLTSLIGELVLARRLLQFNAQLEHAPLNATEQCLHLMDHGMNTRMQPVEQFWNQLPRLDVEAPNERRRLLEARLGPLVRELGMQSLDDLYAVLRASPNSTLHTDVVKAMTTDES